MPDIEAGRQTLRALWRIRAFEEVVRDRHRNGDIVGSVHLCIGQEAVAVGACGALRPDDPLFATYRGHGWALARGVPAESIFAELMGRSTGINAGRGGSAYFCAPAYGFYGENSIVGAGAPIAAGASLAGKFDGSGRVAITVFGDGAMNQGAVHEAFNLAAAFDLPVIFVCENNTWSELTSTDEMVKDSDLYRRLAGYGIPAERLDGNDVEAVRAAVTAARARAASGQGPSFIEAMTQRLVGHYIGDADQYRRPGEVEADEWAEPIARLTRELLAAGDDQTALDAVERDTRLELAADAERAGTAPLADVATMRENLYA